MKIVIFSLFTVLLYSCGNDDLRVRKKSVGTSNALTTNSDCPAIYNPVCGQPPMPACPEGMMCAQMMPAVQTFDNECQMQNAGATLVSNGICP